MGEERQVKRIFKAKMQGRRAVGKPRSPKRPGECWTDI